MPVRGVQARGHPVIMFVGGFVAGFAACFVILGWMYSR